MKGETAHFEMIMDTLTHSFAQLVLTARTPIINCIIPASSIEQVNVRTSDDGLNKGIEAALATIETIRWRRQLRLTS